MFVPQISEKKYFIKHFISNISVIKKTSLNVITFGKTITDNINRVITISKYPTDIK